MGELSRVEDLLETGTEDTVNPLSRVEAILRGEDIKPLSRIEALLEEHSGGGKGGGTYNTDEDKIKNDAFMLHKDTNFLFTDVEKYHEDAPTLLYSWDFTKSLAEDTTGSIAYLSGATFTKDEGVNVDAVNGYIQLTPNIDFDERGRVIEIDIASMEHINVNSDFRLIMLNSSAGLIYEHSSGKWRVYASNAWNTYSETSSEFNAFENTTLKMIVYSNKDTEIYANDILVYKGYPLITIIPAVLTIYIGSPWGNSCDETLITGVRIYKLEEQRNYAWYYNEDKTLVVREKISDGTFRWYFNGINLTAYPFIDVPYHFMQFNFVKNNVIVGCKKYYLSNYSEDCMVGFYNNTIRGWSQGLWKNVTGKVWAIMESTDTGSNQYPDDCYHPWEEPTFDPING